MNLSDITTKPWILALFKRDDGERFLLGDGYYDFKDSLQHFQPNTMANDIVELQGTDGQLLAGQVRRGASQSFDGIIGDGTTTKKVVEERRRDFLMFFRKKHFYTVIYIFCDGTAIKRERGYLVDAPSVPEIRQLAPSYHVALNFENVNYYEYREDSDGNEIYSNTRNVVISTLMTGGLIWDNLGAVSEALQWANEQTAQGAYITINDGLMHAPMSLTQLNGKATQSGTPTPDAPVPVSTVTGERNIKVEGKNLWQAPNSTVTYSDVTWTAQNGVITIKGTTTRVSYAHAINIEPSLGIDGANYPSYVVMSESNSFYLPPGIYTISANVTNNGNITNDKTGLMLGVGQIGARPTTITYPMITAANSSASITVAEGQRAIIVAFYEGDSTHKEIDATISNIMLNAGSTPETFEPYKAQSQEINLGKNLFDAEYYETATYTSGTYKYVATDFEGGKTYTFSATLKAGKTAMSGAFVCISDATNPNNTNNRMMAVYNGNSATTGITASFASNATIYFQFYPTTLDIEQVFDTYDFQLEEGSVRTPYQPFAPYHYELAEVGNYQDRIYKDEGKWYIEKQVGKVVLVGTESYTQRSTSTAGLYRYDLTVSALAPGVAHAISDHFVISNESNFSNITTVCFATHPNETKIVFFSNETTDTAFKTWLASNPTTVYYALATPTTTEITDATLLAQLNHIYKLYGGVNNISLIPSAGAQGTMEISYFTELQPGGGFEWEDGGTGGATIINVEGVDAASPIWTIKGSATNPTLTNITTGQTITWTGTVPSGQTLIIDMDKQTATMEGANVFEFISGDWLDLAPGINRVTYSVLGTDQPSTLSWNNIVG